MNGEFNELATNNTNITFTDTPNNIQVSDELTADPIYTRKMGTAYSIGKAVRVTVIAVSCSLIVAGGALSITTNTTFHNAYLGTLPTIANVNIGYVGETLDYSFDIENKGSLNVYFDIYVEKELSQSLDCSATDSYIGTIEGLGLNKQIEYKIYCTNNIDYKKTLVSGSYITTA